MKTEQGLGSYARGSQVQLIGSFRMNGTTPDQFRDGHSGLIKSVTRNAQGDYTVTLADTLRVKPASALNPLEFAWLTTANPPVKVCQVQVVTDSWDATAKTFRLVCMKTGTVGGGAAAPILDDPDSGARIGFKLQGATLSPGKDPA